MATKVKPVSFTLSLACHICLSKVKNPVVCSNQHVFCEKCLNLWLQTRQHCPSCRVPITNENPAKTIIGGECEEELNSGDITDKLVLMQTRFNVFFEDLKNEVAECKQQMTVERTQKEELAVRLQSVQDASLNSSDCTASSTSDSKKIKRKLNRCSKDVEVLKDKVTQLKKRNEELSEQNVLLLLQNSQLRTRSPAKLSRCTTSALVHDLDEKEKRIEELKEELATCHAIIEKADQGVLEKRMDGVRNMVSDTSNVYTDLSGDVPSSATSLGTSPALSDSMSGLSYSSPCTSSAMYGLDTSSSSLTSKKWKPVKHRSKDPVIHNMQSDSCVAYGRGYKRRRIGTNVVTINDVESVSMVQLSVETQSSDQPSRASFVSVSDLSTGTSDTTSGLATTSSSTFSSSLSSSDSAASAGRQRQSRSGFVPLHTLFQSPGTNEVASVASEPVSPCVHVKMHSPSSHKHKSSLSLTDKPNPLMNGVRNRRQKGLRESRLQRPNATAVNV